MSNQSTSAEDTSDLRRIEPQSEQQQEQAAQPHGKEECSSELQFARPFSFDACTVAASIS